MTGDPLVKLLALFRGEFLGIVQATRIEIPWEESLPPPRPARPRDRDQPHQRPPPGEIHGLARASSKAKSGTRSDYHIRLSGSTPVSGGLLFSTPKIWVEISFPSAVSIVPMPVYFQEPRIFFSWCFEETQRLSRWFAECVVEDTTFSPMLDMRNELRADRALPSKPL